MEAIIAGWAAGYAMSVLCTVAVVYLVTVSRDGRALERFMPGGLPPLVAAVPVSIGMAIAWTLLGTVVGAGYAVLGPGESSSPLPSLPFFASTIVISLLPVVTLLVFWPARWWLWTSLAASFVLLFGLAMPVLAAR